MLEMYISIRESIIRLSCVAVFAAASMLALTAGVGDALAQNTTIPADETQTTTVVAADDNSVIINNGTITITGDTAHGIDSTGANAMITSSGIITTTGTSSNGISSAGANSVINISGSITTSGANAKGIRSAGARSVVNSSGFITTSGTGANGISSAGANSVINISGSITTSGNGANGITSTATNTTISNTGSITTTGMGASGISAGASNATITNSGSIMTTGVGSHGINALGFDSTISISGIVSATGENAFAVKGGDGTQTLTITEDAQITGAIDLGAGDDTVNLSFGAQITDDIDLGEGTDTVNISPGTAGVSRIYTFKNAENFDIDETVLAFTTRTSPDVVEITTLDPTTVSATRVALGATMGQIHRQLSQRLAFAPAPQRLAFAAVTQVAKGPTASDTRAGWGTFFGSRSERDEDGLALAFKHNFRGVVGGYDADIESGQRVGLFAGFGQENIRTSEMTSITDTATRVFAGVYGQHVMGDLTLNGALVFGHASHKSTRTVFDNTAGTETANGKYNSTSISPSLSLNWSHALPNGFELRPSAQVSDTYGSFGGYTETGTTNSNATFGKRTVNIVDSRLQLALAQPFTENRGWIEWRGGVTSTHYGNTSATARLGAGNATSYAVPGDRSLSGGFVGATLHYAIKDRVSLDGDVEYAQTSGRTTAVSGYMSLKARF